VRMCTCACEEGDVRMCACACEEGDVRMCTCACEEVMCACALVHARRVMCACACEECEHNRVPSLCLFWSPTHMRCGYNSNFLQAYP